jgi:hypothetical protein
MKRLNFRRIALMLLVLSPMLVLFLFDGLFAGFTNDVCQKADNFYNVCSEEDRYDRTRLVTTQFYRHIRVSVLPEWSSYSYQSTYSTLAQHNNFESEYCANLLDATCLGAISVESREQLQRSVSRFNTAFKISMLIASSLSLCTIFASLFRRLKRR